MSKKFDAAESGAQREALGVPYMRQLPMEGLAAGAAALEYGAMKYEDRNWEKGLPWHYDNGPTGSGLHHVCMIMAGSLMLSSSVIRGIGVDDRMPELDGGALSAKDCAKFISDQLKLAEEFTQTRSKMK